MEIVIELLTKIGYGILIFGGALLITQLIGLVFDKSIRKIYRQFAVRLRKRMAIFILKTIYKEEIN